MKLVIAPNAGWARHWAVEQGLNPRPHRTSGWVHLRSDRDVMKFRPGSDIELHVLGWPEGAEGRGLRAALLARGLFECEVVRGG
jgi:hypothetical protein